MTLKPVLAVLASAATGFLLGWLIYGLLLASYYESNMTVYEGLMNEPSMWVYIIGNLAWAVLFVYVFHVLASITSFVKGLVAGLVITFLVTLCFDLYFFSGMNLFPFQVMIVDIIANTVLGALMAGVAALVLGTGKK